MWSEYTETSQLLQNNNTNRRKVLICDSLFYPVICFIIIILFVLLLINLSSTDNVSSATDKPKVKQMRRVNLKEVSQVSSKFAKWTKAELETLFMPSKKGNCKPTNRSTFNVDVYLPAAIDWRKEGVIGDVIDQRHCNICWQVCIVQVMETKLAIDHNASHVTPLSIQEFMDCSYTVACEPGDVRAALDYMIDNNMSIVTETQYPLTMKIEHCRYTEFPKGVMIKDYQVACIVSKEYVMSLLAHGPVIATVDPDQWIYYSGGIITQNCNHFEPKHVVQIVGYDCTGEIDYYIVKNSWGKDFGDNGYAYIEMGKNLCGIEDYVTSLNVVYKLT